MTHTNEYGQPVGAHLTNWQGANPPESVTLHGRFCRIVPLDTEAHAADLFAAFALNTDGSLWTYMSYGPFTDRAEFDAWLCQQQAGHDPLFFTIIDPLTDKPVGIGAYLRINPAHGVIEVGHLAFSPLLQRTPIATEAQFLLMQYAFETLGNRRYEWKCNALNEPSCRAAKRLGFQFEGVFRQAAVFKRRNRDTAWFSILDSEWPALKIAFNSWLAHDNFDENGGQKQRLQDFFNHHST